MTIEEAIEHGKIQLDIFGGEHREFIELAIKALEQQPCDDCIIKRQAVLDTLDKMDKALDTDRTVENYKKLLVECYKDLPPVTPKEKTWWIPVSERLPEIHQDILLSLRNLDVEVGFRAEEKPYFYCNGTYIEPQNVLAWMPLPKPYKMKVK